MKGNDEGLLLELRADLQGNVNEKLEQIDNSITKLGTDANRLEPQLTKYPVGLGYNANKTIADLNKMKASLNSLARTSKYVFAGLGASAGFAVKKYADFENGILKVRTISKKSFKDIKKSAEELSVKYGVSVGQITEGNYQLVSSMGDVADAQSILDTTAKLSVAGFTDYSSAMNGLVAVMNGYKMSSKEAGQVADVLMTVQNRGITTVNELQSSLGEVTGTAYNANVKFTDLAASLATITSNKIGTAEAITGLKGAFIELMRDGSEASKNFKKATGEAFDSFMKNHTFYEAIEKLNTYAEKTGMNLSNVFGNVRAGTIFMNLAGSNLKKFKEDLEAVNKSTGTLNDSYKTMSEGAKESFKKLREQFNKTVRDIGEALIPQVKELTKKLEQVDWKKVFSQENINKIVSTGKVIGGVTAGIWALNTAVKTVDTVLKTGAGIKILMSLIGNKLFQKVLISGGSTAFSSLGVSSPAVYGTALTGAGMAAIGSTGLALAGAGTYYGNKAIKNTLGKNLEIKGNTQKEKIDFINTEFKKINNQIKELKESNDNFENVALTKSIEVLQKKKEELKLIRNEILDKKINYSNDGYLTQARGTTIKKEKTKNNKNSNDSFVNTGTDEIKNLMQEYQQFMQNQPKIWTLLGISEKEQLEEKLSFLKGAIKSAVENGATNLIPKLKTELDKTSSELTLKISKIDFEKASKKLKEKLSKIGTGITSVGKKDNIQNLSLEKNAINEFLTTVKTGTTELQKTEIKNKETRLKEIENILETNAKKIKAEQKYINNINSVSNSLISLGNSFTQIGAMTGSSTMGGIGSILGGFGSIAGAMKDWGGIGSITGMFGGGATALSAGMASLGAITGGITAGIALVSTIGSLTGGAKGKKQKAKIDAENKRQLQLYEKNSKHLAKLTEVIINNSRKLETFADRLSDNISKNPTLNRIAKGKGSLINLKDMLVENKVFGDISAVKKGHTYYKKSFGRVGRKSTYTNILLKDKKLLEYLGFSGNSKAISEKDLFALAERAQNITNEQLYKIYKKGDAITKSNVDVWAKNIQEWSNTIKQLSNADSGLFKGATMGSFFGIDYKSNLQLIKEYKDMLKGIGIDADKEQYKDAIQSMIEGNNVLITSMQDVRNSFIDGFSSGKESSFLTGMKSYFNNIFKNVSSIIYDVGFSDIDEYFTKAYEKISNKLVDIKTSGKLDFGNLFNDLDFKQLKSVDLFEKQYTVQIDILKEKLFNSGLDLSIINKILPTSDFNSKINELQSALSNAMNSGLQEHSFDSFTKTLGQSLYENTKKSLIKAFSESKLYQSYISKFINLKDVQKEIEIAGTFKKAYGVIETKLKEFGYRMEANGFGGFDAINNKIKAETGLGNAYYTDKNQNVKFEFHNNYYGNIYGYDDFEDVTSKIVIDNIKKYHNRPRSDR